MSKCHFKICIFKHGFDPLPHPFEQWSKNYIICWVGHSFPLQQQQLKILETLVFKNWQMDWKNSFEDERVRRRWEMSIVGALAACLPTALVLTQLWIRLRLHIHFWFDNYLCICWDGTLYLDFVSNSNSLFFNNFHNLICILCTHIALCSVFAPLSGMLFEQFTIDSEHPTTHHPPPLMQ